MGRDAAADRVAVDREEDFGVGVRLLGDLPVAELLRADDLATADRLGPLRVGVLERLAMS